MKLRLTISLSLMVDKRVQFDNETWEANPRAAGTGPNAAPPTKQGTCEKAKMHWDSQQQKCCSSQTTAGCCMKHSGTEAR